MLGDLYFHPRKVDGQKFLRIITNLLSVPQVSAKSLRKMEGDDE
jgi:hypothetical protein